MIQLVKINQCNHVFDTEQNRYIKSSAKNIHKALGPASGSQTRREMLSNTNWQSCQDPRCRVKQCSSKHYIATNR